MDSTSGISLSAIASTAQSNGDAVTISILKKAMDIQAQTAMALLEAMPQPVQALPDNVGRNLNVSGVLASTLRGEHAAWPRTTRTAVPAPVRKA